jgi:hypothetical protein
MGDQPPKLFVSYSWSSQDHEGWVLNLATQLREDGIDVVLDKWDLREGQDAHAFMEQMVTDSAVKKVIMICDRRYAEKANERTGGVGSEAQIISPELYERVEQTKFVAVLAERDDEGRPCLPAFYGSRIYIDMSSPDQYGTNYDQLVRWVYDEPLHVKPALGGQPAFLANERIGVSTTGPLRRALAAMREGRPMWQGSLKDYFDVLSGDLERFRVSGQVQDFDEFVVRSIDEFLPLRNEAIDVFNALAKYCPTEQSWELLHSLFEKLLPYTVVPEEVTSWNEQDFDNFKFIIHELFLYAIAALIRELQYAGVRYLLNQPFYFAANARRGGDAMVSFVVFWNYLRSLDRRNERLQMRRLSVHADLLEARARQSGFRFQEIMQADLILFIRDCLDCLRFGRGQVWWPVTLLYADRQHGPFEVFARGQSRRNFAQFRQVLDIQTKKELAVVDQAFRERKLRIPSWQHTFFDPMTLIGFDKLGTLP